MIRRMREEDLQAAAELEQKYFSVPWSLKALAESLQNPDYLFVVAETEEKVIGYAGLLKVLDEGDITNIVMEEAFRGQGIGRLLVEGLLDEGRKEGICAFTLEVRAGNQTAIRLYEKLGFTRAGIRPGFYEKPEEDAVIMWKQESEA